MPFRRPTQPLLLLGALLLLALLPFGRIPGKLVASSRAAEEEGTIAYVRSDTRDEIRLIEPDGSNDRHLWGHGQSDPEEVYEIWSMEWSPDASELAFASTHENYCSLSHSDIFAVGGDGTGYRRVTQAPACAELSNYPQGRVRVPVTSPYGFDGFLYFQGAPVAEWVSLPPGGSTTVTFENVADFGDEFLQVATIIVTPNRAIDFGTAVNVQAGATVTTAETTVYTPSTYWETRSPTWRSDGARIGYLRNFDEGLVLPRQPDPLQFGEELVTDAMGDFVWHLNWGPEAASEQLLYVGSDTYDSEGIYRVAVGNQGPGEQLLSFEPIAENVMGLAWLPDGSGFLFSVQEEEFYTPVQSNIHEYRFADRQVTPLTSLTGEFAGRLAISPDGQQVIFERGTALEREYGRIVREPDLWSMNRDGSNLHLLVEKGSAPAWSSRAPQAPPPPPSSSNHIYLPLVLR